MNKKKISIIGVILLVALAVWWLGRGDDAGPGGPGGWGRDSGEQAVAVEVAEVAFRDIRDIAQYTGTLQARHRFQLAPKVGGRLRELAVDIGDEVEQGQVIARLDDEEFGQEAAEARAAMEVARAQLEDARARRTVQEREYQRLADLREQGLASESEYDLAQSEFEAATANVTVSHAQLAQREAALRRAELRQSYATVRAEWNGGADGTRVVGERFVDEGSNIAANEAIISVLDISSLRAVTSIVDRDFARLRTGQQVEIRSDAWPGEIFEGQVSRIAPQLREDTRQARVEIEVPNEDGRLSPGFFVNLSINVEEISDARVVPRDALTRHSGERGVFLVESPEDAEEDSRPRARFVPVSVGVRTDDYAQILSPEIEGRVVTLGQHRLGDGTPLRLTNGE
ncbi:efflux RND transporter periplasmic adaptor subunit [Gammaproteobacteria bacterium AB-CW1]|uniref:Efflux RND transporter periplasmic adaptor subunit n=1 Tax=Natronospira elongata TaxID=3110268 RepID=A0AAP6MLT1_9GAMM|nr:efflux RND transporter periplasmic adaptor subunit [Gammaproteobacteria bacterium AB-CW1]